MVVLRCVNCVDILAVVILQSPYHCNLLIAGYDQGKGPSLYWMDYLATLHQINTGGTGYGEYLCKVLWSDFLQGCLRAVLGH